MGASSSKLLNKKDRIDSFESNAGAESVASPSHDAAVGKRKSSQPIINVDGNATNTPRKSPSPHGKRLSSSSPRASHDSPQCSGRNFLTDNGIKDADSRLSGDMNGNHRSQGSQGSSAHAFGDQQQTEASAAAQNPYILPGTVGTIDIAGTNYISNGPTNTQVYGTSASSYTATRIAHGGL